MTIQTPLQTRRNFLKLSTMAGALLFSCPLRTFAQITGNIFPDILDGDLGLFIKISKDNEITIGAPVPDMGQGVSTAVPMLLADELDADWSKVRIEKLKPHLTVNNSRIEAHKILQNAGGSQSIRLVWTAMREAGAIARQQILMAASQKLGVAPDKLRTQKSFVIIKETEQKVPYGDLIREAAMLPVPQAIPPLKTPDRFTIIGTNIRNEISPDIVRGVPTFGIDMKIEGMRYAMIKRSPYSEGSVSDFNRLEIENMKGVEQTIILNRVPEDPTAERIMSAGVAIIGSSFWAVKKAYDLIDVAWNPGPNVHKSNDWLDEQFDRLYQQKEFETLHQSGNPEQILAQSNNIIEATYENPYWAHVCMEPHNCIASITDNDAKLIVGHQSTARIARATQEVTGLPLDKIDVKVCRMGTGFGRKSHYDYLREAIVISNEIKKPVKVYWTREDEIEQDYFNPKARHVLKAATENGKITAMTYTMLCSNHNTIAAHSFPAHCIEHFRSDFAYVEGLQTGPWRGPMENTSGFTNQSFIDEIAAATDQDPYLLRVSLLENQGQADYETWDNLPVNHDRLLGVLNLVAEKAKWLQKRPKQKGIGRGIACHFTFGGYAAWVIDVRVDNDGALHILKATGAIDCGTAVNPLGIKAQMEGGALDGFSAALGQFVDYRDGRVHSTNYDQYTMARIGDLETEFDIHIMDSNEHPTGAGEIGLPPAIPALLNAIYDATGIRIRKLPIADQLRTT